MSGLVYLRSVSCLSGRCSTINNQTPPLVHTRFRGHTEGGGKGHLCNFVVGDTADRPVFFVNLQTAEVVRSLDQLKDARSYCDDCFFLPSPHHEHSELESLEAASVTLRMKAEEEEDCESMEQ